MKKADIKKKKKALSDEINNWSWNNKHVYPNHDWTVFDLKTLRKIKGMFK